ncbi:MAG: restriction endonuclease subunit S [Candidatus Riflebacteria bacterium]|nr:restriction endonuclease subunit S [Candidatus Riflebacteria bacterium]
MSKFLKVGDVCNITTGSLDSNAFVENGKYPFYTCAKEPTNIDTYAFDDDVVLVAGNNAQGNFHVNRFKGKFNAYQRTYILTSNGEISIDYIYYLLSLALKLLKDKSQGSQTKFLTIGILREIQVPNLPNSQIVAKVLSDLDTKIELNNRINRELEAMAKTLYDYWFVQFDFPNEQGKPYKSSGGKMVYNAELKRKIPEGWEVKTLLDIATYINGFACQNYRPTNEDYLPVIKIREMRDGITENTEKVKADIPDKLIVNDGDVLFSWSASLEVMIWSGGKGALNQHIFKVTSKKYPRSFYYYQLIWYLQHFKMIAELRKTTMGHITQDHLKQSRIVIPPSKIVRALDEKLYPIQEKQILLHKQNQQLSELRDWLLPMLMNGQVTVKAAE